MTRRDQLERADAAHRYAAHLISEAAVAPPARRVRVLDMAAEQLQVACALIRDEFDRVQEERRVLARV
jgi:hypothetical protein